MADRGAMHMRLIRNGGAARLSGAEITALTAERVDRWRAQRQAESDRRAAERSEWRRSQASRRRFWFGVVCVGALGWLGASAYLLTLEGWAALGYVCSLILAGAAIVFARREWRE